MSPTETRPLVPRPKRALAQHFDSCAATRDDWKRGNAYYYRELERLCAQAVPPGKVVLELGCGTGDLLAAVRPAAAHAVKAVLDAAIEAREAGRQRVILFNLSGHGHFDMGAYDAYFSGQFEDYA